MTACRPVDSTVEQIADLQLDADRPLIICDVDEVVLHFIAGFERYLARNSLWLDPASFALNGNVKHVDSGKPVDADGLREHLAGFFAEEIHRLDPISGAAEALSHISRSADVVMLTNLPDEHREARRSNLHTNGMPYPVITNQGPKGPAVKSITETHKSPVVFIDDIPNYLGSVRDYCPDVQLVHFVQDHRFGRHLTPLDYVSLRTDNWQDAHSHINDLISPL